MIILHRIDPEKRMYRWYSVHVQLTLFDPWTVICAWGSLHTDFSQQRAIPCGNQKQAELLASQIVDRKLRCGYSLCGSGAAQLTSNNGAAR